jgi:diguanylate cyclase (GGDEF)-like protein/PAS domain S-box-containing protein
MDNPSHEKLLDSLFDGIYYVDRDRRITFWNKAAERITGYAREEVLGSCCADNLLRHVDENGRELCMSGCPLSATMADGDVHDAHVYLHHKQGHRVPVSVRVSPVRDESGAIVGSVEIFTDNSSFHQILREMEQLKHDAYMDELTGAGNRRYGEMTLGARIHELNAFGRPFGLIFFDIDHFKRCNDTYGHAVGDEVLVMVAKTVMNILRRMDSIVRWGGEEFIVILPGIDLKTLRAVSERIRVFIETSFLVTRGIRLNVTASLGATLARPGDTVESVVQRADGLMYSSKTSGRNRVTTD